MRDSSATSGTERSESGPSDESQTGRNNLELGACLWTSTDDSFAIHPPRGRHGAAIYRGLSFGRIANIPVELVIRKKYAILEAQLAQGINSADTDHRALRTFYRAFVRHGIRSDEEAQFAILERARHCWSTGHDVILEMARPVLRGRRSRWKRGRTVALFGDAYYAQSVAWSDSLRLAYARIESRWDAEGRTRLPAYFTAFGVIDAGQGRDMRLLMAQYEKHNGRRHHPTRSEAQAIHLLERITSKLAPEMHTVLRRFKFSYRITDSHVLRGQFIRQRRCRHVRVELAQSIFVDDLATALSVYLHEHGHLFGEDGSRAFTDVLTDVLEQVIRCRDHLDGYQTRWRELRARVLLERSELHSSQVHSVARQMASLQEDEVRAVADCLPLNVRQLLTPKGPPDDLWE
jgi:hypothetical protein